MTHPLSEDYKLGLSSLEAHRALIEAGVFIPRVGYRLDPEANRRAALAQIDREIAEFELTLNKGNAPANQI